MNSTVMKKRRPLQTIITRNRRNENVKLNCHNTNELPINKNKAKSKYHSKSFVETSPYVPLTKTQKENMFMQIDKNYSKRLETYLSIFE